MINKIFQKLSQFNHLQKKFGLKNSLLIQYQIFKNKPVRVNWLGENLFVNPEANAIYHLLNSLEKIKKLVDCLPNQKYNCILDVGANCGLFSLLTKARFPEAEVYAFEPSPDLQNILNLNLGLKDINIMPLAISNYDGYGELFINNLSQQTNSLIKSSVEIFSPQKMSIKQVKCLKLDSFIEAKKIKYADVIKLDVQGAETLVIEGGKNTLNQTSYLIAEVSFMDNSVFDFIDVIRKQFPFYKIINPVLYGADILFSKEPLS